MVIKEVIILAMVIEFVIINLVIELGFVFKFKELIVELMADFQLY